jgi:undecaprenyl-diphosphatase
MIPINYRPILINGFLECSYPSSTTLLVLSVMPTLIFQMKNRLKNDKIKIILKLVTVVFSLFMVIARLISGVHWVTDIIGSCFLSAGLFYIYKSVVLLKNNRSE